MAKRAKIKAYRECSRTIRNIAQEMNRDKSTILNFLKDPENYAVRKRTGRPSTVSTRSKREIWRLAVDKNMSAGEIKSQMDLPVSKRRILQIVKENTNIQYQQRQKAPKLLPRHKTARMNFDERHIF